MDLNTQKSQNVKVNKDNRLFKALDFLFYREKSDLVTVDDLDDNDNLIESIKNARREWLIANTSFEFAVESELVDYYTYKIKAYQVKYEYLLKIAKEKGVSLKFM